MILINMNWTEPFNLQNRSIWSDLVQFFGSVWSGFWIPLIDSTFLIDNSHLLNEIIGKEKHFPHMNAITDILYA